MSRLNRILLIIVIILAVATALVWLKPDLFSSFSLTSLTSLNPFNREKGTTAISDTAIAQKSTAEKISGTPVSVESSPNTDIPPAQEEPESAEEEVKEEEQLSAFEKEIKQRHQSYETKVYTYEAYKMPVRRNPFQRLVSSVYVGEEEKTFTEEFSTAEDIYRFVFPELPPGTKYTGLISTGDIKLAIIEMEEDTYIAKEGDLIEDRYLVKSIQDNKIIVEVNGYDIVQKLGGEEDINE